MTLGLAATEPLIVGTNAEYAPFTFIEDGQIVGFDIDVANHVAERLNRKIQIVDMPFDALIPALQLGSVQLLAAGMCYTEERAKRVLFTHPYLSGDPLVILSKSKELSLDELKGKTVAVNEGYTADLYLSKNEDINLIRLAAPGDGFLALKSGRVDAFVTAKNTLAAFLAMQASDGFYTKEIEGTMEDCSLVISKKYPALLTEVQDALDAMEKDGSMHKIKTKWKLS